MTADPRSGFRVGLLCATYSVYRAQESVKLIEWSHTPTAPNIRAGRFASAASCRPVRIQSGGGVAGAV